MSMTAIMPPRRTLQEEIKGAIATLEHLAMEATQTQERCSSILSRTAELLRMAATTDN